VSSSATGSSTPGCPSSGSSARSSPSAVAGHDTILCNLDVVDLKDHSGWVASNTKSADEMANGGGGCTHAV
jgi:hypothetical protein